jgi:glycosyltransferase involved in cell wall biosynthesis
VKQQIKMDLSVSLVSICIPSYNYARYLPSTIESALRQTYRNLEVIVVDDGSTDDSLSVARTYQAKYPGVVKVFQHEDGANRGVSATINAGLVQSSGDYLCVVGADDVLLPHKTTRQVEVLEQNPELSLVYSRAAVINGAGNLIGVSIGDDVTQRPDPFECLLYGDAIPESTVMVRRNRLGTTGFWHDENLLHSDWELWLRLLAHFRFGFIDEPLALYRDHGQNMSINDDLSIKFERDLAVMTTLRDKADNVGGRFNDRRMQALIDLQRSFFLFELGRREEALVALGDAFVTDQDLSTDHRYLSHWINGRGLDFTKFVVGTLISRRLMSASSFTSPHWLYVISKAFVKSIIGSYMTEQVARLKQRALGSTMSSQGSRREALRIRL